jgi:hypothetical protein
MPPGNETLSEAFLYDCGPYFSHYPYMSPAPGADLDGNPILYAATFGLIHFRLFGNYPIAPKHSAELYYLSMVEPGMICRGPHKAEDPETHDDYVGLCTLSLIGNGGAAVAIYNRGKKTFWNYSRRGSSFSDRFNGWFFRLAGVPQHFKLCAGEDFSPLDQFLWSFGVFANAIASAKDTSGKILTWHQICAYEISGRKHWLCDLAVRKWKASLLSAYPDAMGGIFRTYFGSNHPFSRWALGII